MKRGRTLIRLLGGICLLGISFLIGLAVLKIAPAPKPSWKTATVQQVAAVVNPILAKTSPASPAESKRYQRFLVKFGGLKGKPSPGFEWNGDVVSFYGEAPATYVKRNLHTLLEIRGLLREGALGVTSSDSTLLPKLLAIKDLVSDRIDPKLSQENRQLILELAELCVIQIYAGSSSVNNLIDCSYISIRADEAISEDIKDGLITPAGARTLLGITSKLNMLSDYQRCAANDFRSKWSLVISNPTIINAQFTELDPEGTIRIYPGNYEAIETAKTYSAIATEDFGALSGKIPYPSAPLAKKVTAQFHDLPMEATKTRFDSMPANPKDHDRYCQAMRQIPNSFGELLLGYIPFWLHVKEPVQAQTSNNLVRTQLAAYLYRREHGHLPATLDDLVSAKLLVSVPRDLYGAGPLRYDPAQELIWSVGEDGVDDHGDGSITFGPGNKDFSVTIPKTDAKRENKK